MIEKVKNIIEVNEHKANKLLETGNCILLGVATVSTENEECPSETEFVYSVGQIKLEDCTLCDSRETVEYKSTRDGLMKVCRNGDYHQKL